MHQPYGSDSIMLEIGGKEMRINKWFMMVVGIGIVLIATGMLIKDISEASGVRTEKITEGQYTSYNSYGLTIDGTEDGIYQWLSEILTDDSFTLSVEGENFDHYVQDFDEISKRTLTPELERCFMIREIGHKVPKGTTDSFDNYYIDYVTDNAERVIITYSEDGTINKTITDEANGVILSISNDMKRQFTDISSEGNLAEIIIVDAMFVGESDHWDADYRIKGFERYYYDEKGTLQHEDEGNSELTYTYKGELEGLADMKSLEVKRPRGGSEFVFDTPTTRKSFSNRSSFGGISKEFMTGENQIEIHLQWDGANGGDETIRFERVEVKQ